nr:hypothetical protein [Tanacetum cinerariifolium]
TTTSTKPPHTPAASPRHSTNFLNRKDLKLRLSDSNSLTVVSNRDFSHRQPIYKEAVRILMMKSIC